MQGSTEPVAQETKTGPTYMQPEFLREEDGSPPREAQRPVIYSQFEAHATQKLPQDAELKNRAYDAPPVEMHSLPPVNDSETI